VGKATGSKQGGSFIERQAVDFLKEVGIYYPVNPNYLYF
jgi:hypothetical protein